MASEKPCSGDQTQGAFLQLCAMLLAAVGIIICSLTAAVELISFVARIVR